MKITNTSKALKKRHSAEKAKETVSAASIFKAAHHHKVKKPPHSHPLATAFKETTTTYRTHIHTTTTTKLSKALSTSLSTLHDSTLQPASSPHSANLPPAHLTVPQKHARATSRIHTPLSAYKIRVHDVDSAGARVPRHIHLGARVAAFGGEIARVRGEVERLQDRWEGVVAEVWAIGGIVLGEGELERVLGAAGEGGEEGGRKKVSFEDEVAFPAFLARGVVGGELVPRAPLLPVEAVDGLEEVVGRLGREQVEGMREVAAEQRRWGERQESAIRQLRGEV